MSGDDFNFTVLEGAPLPPRGKGRSPSAKWAFLEELEVGGVAMFDNFPSPEKKASFRRAAAAAIHGRRSKSDKVFAIRTCPNKTFPNVDGIAIWRTK